MRGANATARRKNLDGDVDEEGPRHFDEVHCILIMARFDNTFNAICWVEKSICYECMDIYLTLLLIEIRFVRR